MEVSSCAGLFEFREHREGGGGGGGECGPITAVHEGRGVFSITPAPGQRYEVRVTKVRLENRLTHLPSGGSRPNHAMCLESDTMCWSKLFD